MMCTNRALFLVAVSMVSLRVASATPVFEWKFDETGTTAANTGSAGATANALSLRADVYGSATDLHGIAGTGVSGLAGDRALNLSALSGHGGTISPYTRGPNVWVTNGNCGPVNGLTTATFSGWFNADSPIPSATAWERTPELFSFGNYSNGIEITFAREAAPTKNEVRVHLDGTDVWFDISTYMAFTDTNKWFFWGFTYDGNLTSNNAKFYIGSASSAVALAGTATMNVGAINTSPSDLSLGTGAGSGTIAFDGRIDNVRIDGSVLSQASLEARRGTDVPEPVGMVLLAVGGLVCLRRRRLA